jgi:hypothetical protein
LPHESVYGGLSNNKNTMKTSSTNVEESGRAGYATDEERWQAVVQKDHSASQMLGIPNRVAALDWQEITEDLNDRGCAVAKSVLAPEECQALAGMYDEDKYFRSRIVMARHGFGRGEYKYWAYLLPDTVAALRSALYQQLFEIANRWNKIMGIDVSYPVDHEKYLARCHRAGQTKPTPFSFNTSKGTITVCTRTFTEKMSFRYRSPFCSRFLAGISRVASSF